MVNWLERARCKKLATHGQRADIADISDTIPATAATDMAGTVANYAAVTALENAKAAGKPIPVAKATGVAVSTIENSRNQEHDSLFVSERLATATPAISATPCFVKSGAVTKTKNSKTGEVVPRRLAMVAPAAGDEFQARLGSFRLKTNPQEIHLVDIFCPAHSGGMKGLTFRADQLPELIRALLSVQTQALERGWLSSPAAVAQQQD